MKSFLCFLAVLGAVATLGAAAQAGTPTAVKGTVVDGAGHPLSAAIVECLAYPDGARLGLRDMEVRESVKSDANGRFELKPVPLYALVVARKAGLAPAWKGYNRPSTEEVRLVLTPTSVLAGTVVDETGKPVTGATVFVSQAKSETQREGGASQFDYLYGTPAREAFSARTATDGRFRIEGFPTNATANLAVRAPGKARQQGSYQRGGSHRLEWSAGQEDIRLTVEPAGSIEGKIAVEGGGKLVSVARLVLQPTSSGYFAAPDPVEARADGTFRIADVGAGSYRLAASFGTNAVPDWVAEAVPVTVESGQTTRDIQVTAVRGGLLEVAAFSKQRHQPVAEVNISAYRQEFQTSGQTGSDGIARLRVMPGNYQINGFKAGSQTANTGATVETGGTNRVEIELAPLPRITGIVRRPDGQPAAGLEVRVVGNYNQNEAMPRTDAGGRFEVEFDPRQFGGQSMTYCLLIRDPAHNLAVAQDIDVDSGALDLRLAPGVTLAGRAECDGKPVTNATAALIFWTGRSGMHLPGLCTGTNTPGRFEIPALPPGRRYGLYVSAPGYGQQSLQNVESESSAKRVELDPVELKPAKLKLAGRVVNADDKPVAGIYVNLHGEGQPNAHATTDRAGRFRFEQVCEGGVQLFVSASGAHANASAEGGDTNVVLRLGESRSAYPGGVTRKVKGVVTDPAGKPAPGVEVAVFPPDNMRWVKTGADGRFSVNWTGQSWQLQSGGDPLLVVRDRTRNLAARAAVSEDSTNLQVQLQPALKVTGRVQGTNDAPLAGADVGVWLLACRNYSDINDQPVKTDARGAFEITALPAAVEYTVYASARGYGRHQEKLEEDSGTNRIELPPFALKLANQLLAGQVLNDQDKPVSGVFVSASGDDQPQESVNTDSKGRFHIKVCAGTIRLFASGANGFGNTTAEAGETNVVIRLARNSSSARERPRRPSLKGKPLPDLASVGLAHAAPTGKPLLLCLLDAEQRPSRHCVRQLAERHEALRQQGVTVLAVQATVTPAESFETWKSGNPLPFSVGRVNTKSPATRWANGMESLPWLILCDGQGKVAAEGFSLDELDAKLKALKP